MKKKIATELIALIDDYCEEFNLSACEITAELLAQMLESEQCDSCHIHWLEFHKQLGERLENKND